MYLPAVVERLVQRLSGSINREMILSQLSSVRDPKELDQCIVELVSAGVIRERSDGRLVYVLRRCGIAVKTWRSVKLR